MINGVEILHTELVQEWSPFSITIMWIVTVFASIYVLIYIIASISTSEYCYLIPGIIMLIPLPFMWSSTIKAMNETSHNQYLVTIDEATSWVEFNSRYKVIKQQGNLYTIVERDLDNAD